MNKGGRSDIEIWNSFVNGDLEAFEQLYNSYFNKLCDFGLRLLNNREIVKDSVQDLFVKLWHNRKNVQNINSPKSYLFTAVRNSVLNILASPSNNIEQFSTHHNEPDFLLEYSPEELLIGHENDTVKTQKLLEALQSLTPRQKESIYLRYYIGLEYDEIAELMQLSKKASYKLIARALEVLRSTIKNGHVTMFWFL
jgi:RNA polymerase sigma factor (sigma-70 family)